MLGDASWVGSAVGDGSWVGAAVGGGVDGRAHAVTLGDAGSVALPGGVLGFTVATAGDDGGDDANGPEHAASAVTTNSAPVRVQCSPGMTSLSTEVFGIVTRV